jgi:hypothetical protein
MAEMLETLAIPCAGCGVGIETKWRRNGGGLEPGEFALVADELFHLCCRDELAVPFLGDDPGGS